MSPLLKVLLSVLLLDFQSQTRTQNSLKPEETPTDAIKQTGGCDLLRFGVQSSKSWIVCFTEVIIYKKVFLLQAKRRRKLRSEQKCRLTVFQPRFWGFCPRTRWWWAWSEEEMKNICWKKTKQNKSIRVSFWWTWLNSTSIDLVKGVENQSTWVKQAEGVEHVALVEQMLAVRGWTFVLCRKDGGFNEAALEKNSIRASLTRGLH